MSTSPDTEKPPSRSARVGKALFLLGFSIHMLLSRAPHHGPFFAIASMLLVLGAIIFLIFTLITLGD